MEILSYIQRGRISNTVWTITGKYGLDVDFSLIQNEYFNYDLLYNSVIIGSLYNILDYRMISDFVTLMQNSANKDREIVTLFFMCIEQSCVNKNIDFIENIQNIRYENYKQQIKNLESTSKKDKLYNMMRLCYFHYYTDKLMIFPKAVVELVRKIDDFKYVEDTLEFIEKFKNIVDEFFKFEEPNETDKQKDLKKKSDSKEEMEKSKNNTKETIDRFFDNYTSMEFNPNESVLEKNFSKDSSTIQDEEVEKDEDYEFEKMQQYYGKSIYSLKETREIEKKYCRKIHKGYHLMFTDANLVTVKDEYRKKQIEEEIKKNEEEYQKNIEFYEQLILKLKSIIMQNINQESKVINKAYSGDINPSVIYRADVMKDYKVFLKKKFNEQVEFSVDIVIDSSASLLEKQEKLSLQAYIISRALKELSIRHSIKTYNSFLDYTIIKILKDYEDKNSNSCFKYYCSGGNRDGLAIDVIGDMSLEENNENYKKIIIVFTDAKPFDVQVLHEIGTKAKKPYRGDIAVNDSAKAIRRLRLKDIKICGIYSGSKENINAIKYIYENDFIYINSIEYFAQKVGKFIGEYMKQFYNI